MTPPPVVIFNPTARSGRAAQIVRHLDQIGAECTLRSTSTMGDARRWAAEAASEGCQTIVAAGGDGTINEVVNGIGDVPNGFERARLGVMPMGTANVFARELAIPRTVTGAWDVIQRGHETRIDLPSVAFRIRDAETRRYFVQLAGAGLDARAIERVSPRLKTRVGPLAYVVSGVRAFLQPQSPVTLTSGSQRIDGALMFITNGRFYGGPFRIAPGADLGDGWLHVRAFRRVDWPTLLRSTAGVLLGRRLPDGVAETVRSRAFTLSSATPIPFQLDGDLIGHLPATFSVEPARLRVLVPG